jgi:hypothetical protein
MFKQSKSLGEFYKLLNGLNNDAPEAQRNKDAAMRKALLGADFKFNKTNDVVPTNEEAFESQVRNLMEKLGESYNATAKMLKEAWMLEQVIAEN